LLEAVLSYSIREAITSFHPMSTTGRRRGRREAAKLDRWRYNSAHHRNFTFHPVLVHSLFPIIKNASTSVKGFFFHRKTENKGHGRRSANGSCVRAQPFSL